MKRIRSFGYAIQGLIQLIKSEPNARIHLLATFLVIMAGVYFRITDTEWILILLSIGLVIGVEAINTSIELLCDHTTPETDPTIKKIKDISAGGVLICALVALAIGLIIFLPKINNLIF